MIVFPYIVLYSHIFKYLDIHITYQANGINSGRTCELLKFWFYILNNANNIRTSTRELNKQEG